MGGPASFERLHCQIFWSVEDESYVMTCDELPGFSVLGFPIKMLLREAAIALPLMMDAWRDGNDDAEVIIRRAKRQ